MNFIKVIAVKEMKISKILYYKKIMDKILINIMKI